MPDNGKVSLCMLGDVTRSPNPKHGGMYLTHAQGQHVLSKQYEHSSPFFRRARIHMRLQCFCDNDHGLVYSTT